MMAVPRIGRHQSSGHCWQGNTRCQFLKFIGSCECMGGWVEPKRAPGTQPTEARLDLPRYLDPVRLRSVDLKANGGREASLFYTSL